MTVQEVCYMCQKRPMTPRERKVGTFFECSNCDAPNGVVSPSRPDEYPKNGDQ